MLRGAAAEQQCHPQLPLHRSTSLDSARRLPRQHRSARLCPGSRTLGSHARSRRSDSGDQCCSRDARPILSRIAGTCPVGITIVIAFTHAQLGRNAALAVLRGSVLSWISFVSRFLATGRSLEALGIAPAIGCVRGGVLWTDRVAHWQVSAGTSVRR